jgi:predicted TIM-barrel fold metal-dependent hydrolase
VETACLKPILIWRLAARTESAPLDVAKDDVVKEVAPTGEPCPAVNTGNPALAQMVETIEPLQRFADRSRFSYGRAFQARQKQPTRDAAGDARMSSRYQGPILDAHHHLWDLSLGRNPWLTSDGNAIRALGDISYLRQNYLVDDLIRDIGSQRVTASVYVEAAWDRARPPVEEISWVESLEKPGDIAARCIAWAALKSPDVAASLEALAEHRSVVGIREVIRWHPDPAKRWTEAGLLDDPVWRRGFALLRDHSFLLELLMNPFQASEVARLAAAFPDQIFVINHCGTPIDRDLAGLERWKQGLNRMGAHENIAIKLSNFGAYGPDRGHEALRATVMTCVDAFGTRRAMFGSDYPVGRRNMSYQESCERFKDIIQDFSPEEQRDLFHDNAARYYGFEKA